MGKIEGGTYKEFAIGKDLGDPLVCSLRREELLLVLVLRKGEVNLSMCVLVCVWVRARGGGWVQGCFVHMVVLKCFACKYARA